VRTVDKTFNPTKITVTPDADPAKNHWNLGAGSDTPPGGFPPLVDEGYGAECVWNVAALGLIPGHVYRAQFIVHDGDQNKVGGDCGEACTTIQYAPTAVEEPKVLAFALKQNVPNPFKIATTIRYTLAEESQVRLSVIDLAGREVASLVNGTEKGGEHAIEWKGIRGTGELVPQGIYFYRLEAKGALTGQRNQIRKMIMLK
jgi:hypothetical protein